MKLRCIDEKELKEHLFYKKIVKFEEDNWKCLGTEYNNHNTVTIYSNQNPVAQADCYADAGNGGYYFSVCSLVIGDVYFPVVEA